MKSFVFGIENYCNVKFIGDKDSPKKNKWFVNQSVMLKNGFDLDEIIISPIEIKNIDGKNNFYEVECNGIKRYFDDLDLKFPFLYDIDLSFYFKPIDELIRENIKFFFLIETGDYECISRIKLNDNILKYLSLGQCIIVFNTSYEPCDPHLSNFLWEIKNFSIKYNLSQNNFKIITGNLIIENKEDYPCEFIPYYYFLENPWFIRKDKKNGSVFNYFNSFFDVKKNTDELKKFIDINKSIKKFEKKILCYNRRPRSHRRYLFYRFFNNPIISQNIFLSLNNEDPLTTEFFSEVYGMNENEVNEMNQFFYNNRVFWQFDGHNLNINLADNFEEWFHKNTFLSVVSETSDSKGVVFFSEKTFKPIFACQPFIMSGNARSLEVLKKMGFKTFDKWWDESYDSEERFEKRTEMIMKILEEICNKSDEELCKMLNEMEDILIHNYMVFMSARNNYFMETFSSIGFECNKII